MELKNLSKYRSQIYGFSILWIMLFHAIDILDLHYDHFSHYLTPLDAVLAHGNIGVDIFLFLSGVCLYFSFQKSQDIGVYMRKRAMRLYLPAIVIDGWYWLVFFWLLEGSFFRFARKITLVSFWINGDQMIWFVSLILLLYVFYPYIYSVIFGGARETAWLQRLLAFFGDMSLELYLSHILMIHLYRRTPFGAEKRLLEYLVLLILAVAVAWTAKKVCDRISARLQGRAAWRNADV